MKTIRTISRVLPVISVVLVGNIIAAEKDTGSTFMSYRLREAAKRRIVGAEADEIRKQYNVGPEGVKGVLLGTFPDKNETRSYWNVDSEVLCGRDHPAVKLAQFVAMSKIGYSIKEGGDGSLCVKCHLQVPDTISPELGCGPISNFCRAQKRSYPSVSDKQFSFGECRNWCSNNWESERWAGY